MNSASSLLLPGHIELADAFNQALEALKEAILAQLPVKFSGEDLKHDAAIGGVERLYRDALADREVPPVVRDPITGHAAELANPEKWRRMSFDGLGLDTFVDPHTNPGPDAAGLPVMVEIAAHQQWLSRKLAELGSVVRDPDMGPKLTARFSKSEAVSTLSGWLSVDNQMTRETALKRLRDHGTPVSRTALLQEVWPVAREAAGLSRKAAPGRKANPGRLTKAAIRSSY